MSARGMLRMSMHAFHPLALTCHVFLLPCIDYIASTDSSQWFDMRKLILGDAFSITVSCWEKDSASF